MSKIKIGITMRVTNEVKYEERRDAIAHKWVQLFEKVGLMPVFLPNNCSDIERYIEEIDLEGIVLTGGNDIHPDTFYNGLERNGNNGDYSLERDDTEIKIIKFAENKEIPLLGICRGMQLVTLYYGGKLYKNENCESVERRMHAGVNHLIKVIDDDYKIKFCSEEFYVNSFHNFCISLDNLPSELSPMALCTDDDSVEAFYHKSKKILCMMWHPERNIPFNDTEVLLLKKFFCKRE